MPTHVEVMAETLAAHGVEYVFGLPGGEIVAFLDACRRAGIRFLLTGHEASAAWMAQAVGQMTGVPGVCAATLGPGATNLITGVANALLDRAALLAVTAQIPGAAYDTMTHQRLRLNDLFEPVTKKTVTLGSGDTAEIAYAALHLAAAPRPGPVHIAIPSDVATGPCSRSSRNGSAPVDRSPDARLDEVASRLNEASRPLLLIGLGALPSAAPAIRSLAARLQAPFITTPKAKGILPEDDPLFLGVATGMAMDGEILETIRQADLVLAIGFDPIECDKLWFADAPIVSVDSVAMSEGSYRPLEALGDIGAQVTSLIRSLNGPKPWPRDLLASRRKAIQKSPIDPKSGLSPLRLVEELRHLFPRDTIAACDVGSHKMLMGQFWRSFDPNTFFMSNGLSGMGFGLPTAMAAQLLYPEKPVLAVVGDGGMLMMVHDLVLMRDLQLPVITVVLADGSLSLIRVSQERRGFAPYGVDFQPPDFAAIACASGICGKRAATIPEVRAAVESALVDRKPLLLEVSIDYHEYYSLV